MGHGVNGAFTTYVAAREDQCYRIPDGISLEEAALCDRSLPASKPSSKGHR
jgi:threonine dehydrogenase-like Zn-dependent dehydrogenase